VARDSADEQVAPLVVGAELVEVVHPLPLEVSRALFRREGGRRRAAGGRSQRRARARSAHPVRTRKARRP
jgi:hypothetical protein